MHAVCVMMRQQRGRPWGRLMFTAEPQAVGGRSPDDDSTLRPEPLAGVTIRFMYMYVLCSLFGDLS